MATLVLYPETEDSRLILLNKPSLLIGSAPEADICLESGLISERHARIEQKPDGYYLINLAGTPGVLVNGTEVTFQRLKHGDKLEFGGVKAVLLLSDKEAAHETPAHEAPTQEMMLPASMMSTGLATMPRGPTHCPQCGMPLMPGSPSCPRCGLQFSNFPAIPMDFIPPIQTGQAGPGILPIIAFLAALTVVGAPIALVLGLMTLSIIRRRGGTVRDRSLAKWAIGLGLLWLMLGAVGAGSLVQKIKERKRLNAAEAQKREQLKTMEVNEAKVIRALKNLACSQKYAHTIECFDSDSDGQGEYGTLPVLTETRSPFFDTDLADGKAYGYEFAIHQTSEGQFLAAAEPVRHGETGIRTFTINQDGQIRGGDTGGQRFGQGSSMLPVLQGERSAYYEIDDEIAKDVLNYVKTLSSGLPDQEKKQRILMRLRKDYALTSVGRELDGIEASVDRFVTEQRAQAIYLEAKAALKEGSLDVALAKLMELKEKHPSFSEIAAAERELGDLRSGIAQKREQEALALFTQAEEIERKGQSPQEVQQLYQRIEKLYPDTEVATRIASLKPELQRQLREHSAEEIFSDLMEFSPERDYDEILNRANQLRRNYKDTNLFGKMEKDLAEKERKARAGSWRAKTEQSMAAGRMRAALAQLESATRENPDLMYDLQDLYIKLYRHVANALMEEGDARKALAYYEKLGQLLQVSGSEEQVSQDLLAKLHNVVGQADYELKDYAEARRHFSSAAWKYPDDAQLNMRLGAANLFTGLYRPAETSLTQALNVQTNMTSARLYQAYLNLRVVLSLERVLANTLKQAPPETNSPSAPSSSPASNSVNPIVLAINNTGSGRNGTTVVSSGPEDSSVIAAPEDLKLKQSTAEEAWFSSFAGNETEKNSSVPEPTDMDLFMSFDYQSSRNVSPEIMKFLEKTQALKNERMLALSKAKAAADKLMAMGYAGAAAAARKKGEMEIKTSEEKNLSKLRSELSQLRTIHLTDADARKELFEMMNEMKQRIRTAASDIQAAGETQPLIRSMTENIRLQINAKYEFLLKAETLISRCMKEEVDLRKEMLELAEEMLLKDSISISNSSAKDVSRFSNKIYENNNVIKIEQALRSLRDSMDVNVDLSNILRAAEGHVAGNENQAGADGGTAL
ncbi:MAG: FHA domain-containing protein [Pontiellaceae bacterium]|jgi:hypothetical protein|nr:FHA domain-containing protein [Pontiellaceae bacterium]